MSYFNKKNDIKSLSIKILEELKKREQNEDVKVSFIDDFLLRIVNLFDRSQFTLKDKVLFFRELSFLLKGGVSIIEAINIIKDSTDKKALKDICEKIYLYLKRGDNFSRILVRLYKYFNDTDIAVIRAGEQSGELVKVLEYLANQYEFIYKIKQKYFSAILYPLLLFLLSVFAIIFFLIFVIPNLLEIVKGYGVELPIFTKVLLYVSNFLVNNGIYLLISIILFLFGISIFVSTEEGRKFKDKIVLSLPILGRLTKYYYIIKFLRYLKLLIYSGMPFVEVFYALKKIMSNSIYDSMLNEAINSIRRGESPFDVMEKYTIIIPKDVIAILKVGEETASIDDSVDSILELYETEFTTTIESLSKFLEPVLVIIVGGIIALIALSIFGIIGNLLDAINR